MKQLATGCQEHGLRFYVIGDVPSPSDFYLPGCPFYSLTKQAETGFPPPLCFPVRHYARKNIGYLLAAQAGTEIQIETDDNNYSLVRSSGARGVARTRTPILLPRVRINVYRYFPMRTYGLRRLPLDVINEETFRMGTTFLKCRRTVPSSKVWRMRIQTLTQSIDWFYLCQSIFGGPPHSARPRRLVSLQQPKHHLVSRRLSATLSSCILLLSNDRYLAQLHCAAYCVESVDGASCFTSLRSIRNGTSTI